jgi:hypothetical protein
MIVAATSAISRVRTDIEAMLKFYANVDPRVKIKISEAAV